MTLSGPVRRVLLTSLVGSAIEWFDLFLYGSAAAIVFNRLFFQPRIRLFQCCCPISRSRYHFLSGSLAV
jgi:hypothetical protein